MAYIKFVHRGLPGGPALPNIVAVFAKDLFEQAGYPEHTYNWTYYTNDLLTCEHAHKTNVEFIIRDINRYGLPKICKHGLARLHA